MSSLSTQDCKRFIETLERNQGWASRVWKRLSKSKSSLGWTRVFETSDGSQLWILEPFNALFDSLEWSLDGQSFRALGEPLSAPSLAPSERIASDEPPTPAGALTPSADTPAVASHFVSASTPAVDWRSALRLPMLPPASAPIASEAASQAWSQWLFDHFKAYDRHNSRWTVELVERARSRMPSASPAGLRLDARAFLALPSYEQPSAVFEKPRGILGCFLVCGSFMSFSDATDEQIAHASNAREQHHYEQRRALHQALSRLALDLLDRGAELSALDLEGALHLSAGTADAQGRLRVALSRGLPSDFNPRATLALLAGDSALAAFRYLDSIGAVEASLLQGWDQAPFDEHPLARALACGGDEMIAQLLEPRFPLGWRDPSSGVTLWHLAAGGNQINGLKAIQALAARSPGMSAHPALETTPVHWSSPRPEPRHVIKKGRTALHQSCDDIFDRALLLALADGADPNLRDAAGDTPLMILARRWGAKAEKKAAPMVRALLAAGADPGLPNSKGLTAAQIMAQKGPLGPLAELLELRPQDVGGDQPAQAQAQSALASRGGAALSLAEKASFESLRVEAPSSRPRKPRSRGL